MEYIYAFPKIKVRGLKKKRNPAKTKRMLELCRWFIIGVLCTALTWTIVSIFLK